MESNKKIRVGADEGSECGGFAARGGETTDNELGGITFNYMVVTMKATSQPLYEIPTLLASIEDTCKGRGRDE